MPPIPQYNRPVSIQTQPLGPKGSPPSFGVGGEGLAAIGQGLNRAAAGAVDLGDAMQRSKLKKDRDASITWTGNAMAQLGRVYSDFINNEENLKSQTLDADFKSFADEQIKKYSRNAPNKDAADEFSLRSFEATTAYMDNAFRISSRNRVDANYNAVNQQVKDAVVEMHNLYQTSGTADAAQSVIKQRIGQIESGIEQVFDGMTAVQAEHKNNLYKQMALAAVDSDPEFAKKLASSRWLSEDTRRSVLAQIEKMESGTNSMARVALEAGVDSAFNNAKMMGTPVEQTPLAAFQAVYPPGTAEARYEAYRIEAEGINLGNSTMASVSGLNSQARASEIVKLRDQWNADPKSKVLEHAYITATRTNAAHGEMERLNLTAYLQQNHPIISQSWKNSMASSALSDQERAAARNMYYDQLEHYQGPASYDEKGKPIDPSLHFNQPFNLVTLMSEDEAAGWAADIQGMDTANISQKFASFEAQFQAPGDSTKTAQRISRAMDDVVRLGKLNGSYELAYMARHNAGAMQLYVNALNNREGTKELLKKKYPWESLEDSIKAHPKWLAFENASNNDFSRGDRLNEYREGLTLYAAALVNTGVGSTKAVMASIHHLLTDSQESIATENNGFLRISKRRANPNAPVRDDVEIETLTDGANHFFRQFQRYYNEPKRNPMIRDLLSKMRLTGDDGRPLFPITEEAFATAKKLTGIQGELQDIDKRAAISKYIADNGRLVSSSDGNYATLWVAGDYGLPFQVVDEREKPIRINFDQRLDGRGIGFFNEEIGIADYIGNRPMGQDLLPTDEKLRMRQFILDYPQFREMQFDFPDQGIYVDHYINQMRRESDWGMGEGTIKAPKPKLNIDLKGLQPGVFPTLKP